MINERIRKVREVRGLSQAKIAELLNTSQQNYSHMEKEGSNPTIGTLRKFCMAVGVSVSFLVGDGEINEKSVGK